MEDELREHVRMAAGRADVRDAVRELYARVQAKVDERKPVEVAAPIAETEVAEQKPIESATPAAETRITEQLSMETTAVVAETVRRIEAVSDVLPTQTTETKPREQVETAADAPTESSTPPAELPPKYMLLTSIL